MQDFQLATLIGEETQPCNQFGEPYRFTLPHSTLYGGISTAQYVRANGDARDPRGALPHREVRAVGSARPDPVIATALEHIKSHKR